MQVYKYLLQVYINSAEKPQSRCTIFFHWKHGVFWVLEKCADCNSDINILSSKERISVIYVT